MCGECRDLLNEAMNLAVRSEQFEGQRRREAALDASVDPESWQASGQFDAYVQRHNARHPSSRIATRSMTMHLWVQDQYDKDLASWRGRAAAHLSQCNDSRQEP